jgi:hypothetical protein
MDSMQGFLDSIANQQDEGGAGGGQFYNRGKYKATLIKAFAKNGYKGFALHFHWRIDAATKTDPNVEPNLVGSTAKTILKTNDPGKKGTMAKINAQRIIRALFNLPEKAPPAFVAQLLGAVCNIGQAPPPEVKAYLDGLFGGAPYGRGMAVNVECFSTTTEQGKALDVQSFSHDPLGTNAQEIAKRRAELDAA